MRFTHLARQIEEEKTARIETPPELQKPKKKKKVDNGPYQVLRLNKGDIMVIPR